MKLAIGSRGGKDVSFTGMDSFKTEFVDIVHATDTYPWPLPDNSVDEMTVIHQYVTVFNVYDLMKEIYRVCKPDSQVKLINPYYSSVKASANPDILRQVSEYTFLFYDPEFRKVQHLESLPFSFKAVQHGYTWQEPWNKKSEEAKEYAKTHYWNIIEDLIVDMKVVK